MKNIYKILQIFLRPAKKDGLIEFISDKKNLEKAVEGSMQKRIDLIDRVRFHKNSP